VGPEAGWAHAAAACSLPGVVHTEALHPGLSNGRDGGRPARRPGSSSRAIRTNPHLPTAPALRGQPAAVKAEGQQPLQGFEVGADGPAAGRKREVAGRSAKASSWGRPGGAEPQRASLMRVRRGYPGGTTAGCRPPSPPDRSRLRISRRPCALAPTRASAW
jgi:hypothetical protein